MHFGNYFSEIFFFLTSLYSVLRGYPAPNDPMSLSKIAHISTTPLQRKDCVDTLGSGGYFHHRVIHLMGLWVGCFLRETAIGYSIVVDVIYPDREDNDEDFFESFWNHSCPSCSRTNGISHFHISLAVQVYLLTIWLPGYPRNGWDGFLDTRHETSWNIDWSLAGGWIFDRDPKLFTLWRVIFAIYSIYILVYSILSYHLHLIPILTHINSPILFVLRENTLFSFQSCSMEQQLTAIETNFGIQTICRDWHVEAQSEPVRLPKCESRKGL